LILNDDLFFSLIIYVGAAAAAATKDLVQESTVCEPVTSISSKNTSNEKASCLSESKANALDKRVKKQK
jgi:hypothetical protein